MPNSSNPYAPDEPAAEVWLEETVNAGVYLGAIGYGVHISVFSVCAYYVVKEHKKGWWKWLAFIIILFAMATINICMNIYYNQLAWINDRNIPGGPVAYLTEMEADSYNNAGNSASLIATFLADGLLLYRVKAVWGNVWYIIAIPFLMWLASAALGILTVIQAARPDSSLWSSNVISFAIPYWSLLTALNILLTLLLISRLMYMRHRIAASSLGSKHGAMYTGVATMVLESALPYAIISIIFIVLYGLQNTAENLFLPLLEQTAGISPELIILRVARGHALTNEAMMSANVSSFRFGSTERPTTTTNSNRTETTSDHMPMMSLKLQSDSRLRRKGDVLEIAGGSDISV